MITSFRSKALRRLWEQGDGSKLPVSNVTRVERILARLDAAAVPDDMNLPGYRFHGLHGKPKRFAVDASGNYRVTFAWDNAVGDAIDVDIEDYH
jgi:proteic killer suppression protein